MRIKTVLKIAVCVVIGVAIGNSLTNLWYRHSEKRILSIQKDIDETDKDYVNTPGVYQQAPGCATEDCQ